MKENENINEPQNPAFLVGAVISRFYSQIQSNGIQRSKGNCWQIQRSHNQT